MKASLEDLKVRKDINAQIINAVINDAKSIKNDAAILSPNVSLSFFIYASNVLVNGREFLFASELNALLAIFYLLFLYFLYSLHASPIPLCFSGIDSHASLFNLFASSCVLTAIVPVPQVKYLTVLSVEI